MSGPRLPSQVRSLTCRSLRVVRWECPPHFKHVRAGFPHLIATLHRVEAGFRWALRYNIPRTARGHEQLSMGENVGNTPLSGCYVFVDTRDKANNDNSAMWSAKIEKLGGKVAKTVTDKLTHVVFQGGKKTVRAGDSRA